MGRMDAAAAMLKVAIHQGTPELHQRLRQLILFKVWTQLRHHESRSPFLCTECDTTSTFTANPSPNALEYYLAPFTISCR